MPPFGLPYFAAGLVETGLSIRRTPRPCQLTVPVAVQAISLMRRTPDISSSGPARRIGATAIAKAVLSPVSLIQINHFSRPVSL
jgi:hypothetical protein